MRFFAHAPHAPDCEIAREGESEAHHLLTLELAWAARDAGAHAELEVRAPDGSWRADVLASAPDGSWRIALEAQLSPITDTDITARTERMRQHGVAACWFSDRPGPPWLGAAPSVRVAREQDGGPLAVAEGLVRFDGRSWRMVRAAALPDLLRWVFYGQAVPHSVKSSYAYEDGLRSLPVAWTHPRYIAAEETRLRSAAARTSCPGAGSFPRLRTVPRRHTLSGPAANRLPLPRLRRGDRGPRPQHGGLPAGAGPRLWPTGSSNGTRPGVRPCRTVPVPAR
ncbi:competence protein CoiA family protein [Streptomyces sp. NBC_00536]|nr:competence protein CoiA family protein [Streptomyces sp. NBC_00536]